jgi:hypothetical protein
MTTKQLRRLQEDYCAGLLYLAFHHIYVVVYQITRINIAMPGLRKQLLIFGAAMSVFVAGGFAPAIGLRFYN